jgi:MFS family permease
MVKFIKLGRMGMTDLTTKKRITIFVALMLAVFLGSLDMTVVSTSLITIVKDLKGFDLYTWAFTSYMLMATISMPLFGKLADRFGHKKIYVFGIVVFVLVLVLAAFHKI